MTVKTQSLKITVDVKPNAKHDDVFFVSDGHYRVTVHAPAQDGKANLAVRALIAKHFRVPKSDVTLLSGETSRLKRFEIDLSRQKSEP